VDVISGSNSTVSSLSLNLVPFRSLFCLDVQENTSTWALSFLLDSSLLAHTFPSHLTYPELPVSLYHPALRPLASAEITVSMLVCFLSS
jgi:hypothetical protein